MRKDDVRELRRQAEERLAEREHQLGGMERDEVLKIAHELSVHQAELEIQNEELRQTRTKLEETRDWYLELYDFSPVGYFTLDEHRRVVEANLTGCRLLLMDRQKLLNEQFTKFITDDETDNFYLFRKKVLESENKQTLELKLKKADGNLLDTQLIGIKTGMDSLRITVIDITERKQMEDGIQKLNDTLKLIRNINQLIVRTDNEPELLQKGCEELTRDEHYPLAWIGFVQEGSFDVLPVAKAGKGIEYLSSTKVTWDDAPTGMGPTGMAIKTGQAQILKDATIARFQAWRERERITGFKSSIALPLVVQKKVMGVLTIYSDAIDVFHEQEMDLFIELAQDLSLGIEKIRNREKRAKAEQSLADEAVRRRILVEQSSDGIVVLDQKGKVFEANKRFAEMLGYSAEEVLQLHVWDWDTRVPGEQVDQVPVEITGPHFETKHRRKDGSTFDVEISSNEAIIAGQKLVFCVCRDVTERNKAEEERRRLKEKAEIAGRLAAVGEMAAGIAHEINNPLTGVLGFSKLLLEEENVPDEIKENLKVIADGSQRVADIVKGLLTFAREVKPIRSSVNLNELIVNTLKLREYVLKTANIEVVNYFDPELPWSVVDPGQLQQVFMNLIVNAEQAIKGAHGKGTLIVTTEKHNGNIRISIQDDGPGIAKKNLPRLFDPFFTTKAPGEGTGLGLSLSRSIVIEHGGEIRVESELGHGATFIIELPVIGLSTTEIDATPLKTKVESTTTKKGRILVVDDEPGVRDLTKMALTQIGHSVDTTSIAKEALDRIGRGITYDIIITDIRMPGMSGPELYQHILSTIPELAKRIIFITGDVMGVDVSAFLKKYDLPYLAKPFTIKELREIVDIILKGVQSD